MQRTIVSALALSAGLAGGAAAQVSDECRIVRLFDPGWTDITATTGVATVLLEGLGYAPQVSTLSVPIGYQAMSAGDIDVFLGNWMPSHQNYRADLDADGAVEVLNQNLDGAVFTLAVPSYVSDEGVTDFAHLDEHAGEFGSTIYGIEPGAVANQHILNMIDANEFGLGDWSLVESGEQAMLAQVSRAERAENWIVFLAWAPHPMNTAYDITYLAGGDDYFGPDFGGAEVYTLARAGWSETCPNAAEFFRNLTFDIDMENELMGLILDEGATAEDAARTYIEANPGVIEPWLEGVTTVEGEAGLPAVQEALGL